MKFLHFTKAIALGFLIFGSASHQSEAAVIVQNFALSASPHSTSLSQTGGFRTRAWIPNAQINPFNIAAGDTLQVNITFNAPVTVQDYGNPSNEFVGVNFFNFNTAPNFSSSFVNSSVTYSNTSGDFLGNPAAISGTILGPVSGPNGRSESLGLFRSADITSSIMTFTAITFVWNYSSVDPQTMPFFLGALILGDDATPVPTPGVLALLGLGLLQLVRSRRRLTLI